MPSTLSLWLVPFHPPEVTSCSINTYFLTQVRGSQPRHPARSRIRSWLGWLSQKLSCSPSGKWPFGIRWQSGGWGGGTVRARFFGCCPAESSMPCNTEIIMSLATFFIYQSDPFICTLFRDLSRFRDESYFE